MPEKNMRFLTCFYPFFGLCFVKYFVKNFVKTEHCKTLEKEKAFEKFKIVIYLQTTKARHNL